MLSGLAGIVPSLPQAAKPEAKKSDKDETDAKVTANS
jgi:hypothetical protein